MVLGIVYSYYLHWLVCKMHMNAKGYAYAY